MAQLQNGLAVVDRSEQNASSREMTHRIAKSLGKLGGGARGATTQDIAPRIRRGQDPLGEYFLTAVSPEERRAEGATFTPAWMVELQLDRMAAKCCSPARIIDAGAGTGRYAVAAARRWPKAEVIAVEKDPHLARAARTTAAVAGVKIKVLCADYTTITLPRIEGVTAFVGNPPYVRHHDINADGKLWFAARMERLGLPCSQLAGLHIHFFLQSFLLSKAGDIGSFITAAEWLETNYGRAMRTLFARMGGDVLIRGNPEEQIFDDALTTSIISEWTVGSNPPLQFADLHGGRVEPRFVVDRQHLRQLDRWPAFGRELPPAAVAGGVLGDLFKVSRGQVTGCNAVWIANEHTEKMIPSRYLFPCVTDAREIIEAGGVLRDSARLRKVIDLPVHLDELTSAERARVDEFLEMAKECGASESYIAQHRTAWWRVGLKAGPAMVMTYMGRRPPVFARNACGARIINIAHGLTPRSPIKLAAMNRIVAWLNDNVQRGAGRTYGGGLTKFEPSEAMKIPLPAPGTFD